jgi:hypothetical protein
MFDPQVKEALAWAYTANLPAQDTFHEFIQHLTMALCEIGECQSRLTLRPTSTINIKTGAQSNSKAAVYGLMTLWLSTWEAAFVVWYYTNLLDFTWTNHFFRVRPIDLSPTSPGLLWDGSRNAHATYIHLHTM